MLRVGYFRDGICYRLVMLAVGWVRVVVGYVRSELGQRVFLVGVYVMLGVG